MSLDELAYQAHTRGFLTGVSNLRRKAPIRRLTVVAGAQMG
ncbi:hypothetical protein [Thiohalocapsa sp. ML1]|jgi:hypothetical protein|nr:hypothetical protein [Thiohalocapsa sp. ML1]